ncbi:hypothetical protein VIBNISOn1_530004 [Vibrio nigripulchritudo SOn1]|uniref:Uncharacterized protein n=1 Tax=Vibrio nigripulchritudo SOn1 TaxID=1238450 RepID=A0AAV2VUZ3_9VIBR|nr:hypothetical protein [Vibrio nigripulchritudo]CCO48435.1 hypothetical protein VIBNISOn1_530004 [Vibrio nigripulchritudo SOn1]
MNILKYNGSNPNAKKSSGSYIYLLTDGTHPNVAKKAVLVLSSKFTNISSFPRRKEVYQFLQTESGKPVIFRINAQHEDTWVKIDRREGDYCVEEFSHLFKVIEENTPNLLNSGVWRDAINSLFGISAYTWRRVKAPFSHGTADGEMYRELRFVETGLTNLQYIVKEIVKRKVTVTKISDAERAEIASSESCSNGQSQLVFELSTGGYGKVTFDGDKPRVLLNKGLFQVNQPLWRIKLKKQSEWTLFCAVNLGATNCFVEFLSSNGIEPFSTLLNDGESGSISDLFGIKNRYPELDSIIPLIDIEVLTSKQEWIQITKSHFESAQYQRAKIERKYGVSLLEGLHRSITHKSAQLESDASDLVAYKKWCDQIRPTFNNVKDTPKSTRARATKSVKVNQYVQTTNGLSDQLKKKRQTLAINCFVEHWKSIHHALSIKPPKLETNAFHDASNKRREYYVDSDSNTVKVTANSGMVIHQVNDELDDAGTGTIVYIHPKYNINGTFTMSEYLSLKAAETIADYITSNPEIYASHMRQLEVIKPATWKKQVPMIVLEILR